jgi:hypothetical protein
MFVNILLITSSSIYVDSVGYDLKVPQHLQYL